MFIRGSRHPVGGKVLRIILFSEGVGVHLGLFSFSFCYANIENLSFPEGGGGFPFHPRMILLSKHMNSNETPNPNTYLIGKK